MGFVRQHRSWGFALLVAVLFLCARAGSIAHAANYGSAPHNHDSAVCVFSVLANDDLDDLAMPPSKIIIYVPPRTHLFILPTPETHLPAHSIAGTARGPPSR
ncbi:MAG: hypothetical protein JKY25_06425 [Robiginitomaculum sp.]|nr:hypothetical protein [Robiginitomaculum sp.]